MSQFQLYRDGKGQYRWRLITKGRRLMVAVCAELLAKGLER